MYRRCIHSYKQRLKEHPTDFWHCTYLQDLQWNGMLQTKNLIHRLACNKHFLIGSCYRTHNPMLIYRWTLAYTVSDLLQHEVNEFVEQWSSHGISQSRSDCIGGIPDDLYDMPRYYGQHFVYCMHNWIPFVYSLQVWRTTSSPLMAMCGFKQCWMNQ